MFRKSRIGTHKTRKCHAQIDHTLTLLYAYKVIVLCVTDIVGYIEIQIVWSPHEISRVQRGLEQTGHIWCEFFVLKKQYTIRRRRCDFQPWELSGYVISRKFTWAFEHLNGIRCRALNPSVIEFWCKKEPRRSHGMNGCCLHTAWWILWRNMISGT